MRTAQLQICPLCNTTGLKHLPTHLKIVHKLIGEEREQMLRKVKYLLPAEIKSNESNIDFTMEVPYPCMSEECDKVFYSEKNLKKHVKVHDWLMQSTNLHECALKAVNEALRCFTVNVQSNNLPHKRCYECNEFMRHVNCMLQDITL